MSPFNNLLGKFGKSKTLDSTCRPCPNSMVDFQPQQAKMYNNYQPHQNHVQSHPHPQPQLQQVQPQLQMQPQQHIQLQPQPFHHPPICHQHQPMPPTIVSPCQYPCMAQLIQQPQQSVPPYAMQNQYQNHTIDSRVTESAPVGSQTQFHLPHTMTTMPVYQSNQAQAATISNNQSPQYIDNHSIYYNQTAVASMNVQQQQQQHQHHHHHHQQPPQQQPQPQFQHNQVVHHQQQQQFQNNQQIHPQQHQLDDQRHKFQQQSEHSQLQQNQQMQLHLKQQQDDSQRQYQNRQQVAQEAYYGNGIAGDGDLPLEAKCLMHESSSKELTKQAYILRNDFENLTAKLEIIRKKLPDYSVNEVKI